MTLDIDAIDRDIQTASDGIEGPDAPYHHAALCAMSAARLLRAEVDRLSADNQRLRDGIEQVAVELDRSTDTADQADTLRALLNGDGTGTLWAVHHRGSDEYYAQPSRAEAERMKAWLDGYDAARHGDPYAALHKALVVEWPLSAEQHAAQLAEAVAL